jgi:hypothetical protein
MTARGTLSGGSRSAPMEQSNSMTSLDCLKTRLREIEVDIQETSEEIKRQKDVVRQIEEPFKRRYAEHVLASYQEQRKTALANHLEISNRMSEKKIR